MGLTQAIEKRWYSNSPGCLYLLLPLEGVFRVLARARRKVSKAKHCGVPVIVVGNLAVGGSGKTPLVLALAKFYSEQGYRVGIVSRGYGGKAPHYPFEVGSQTDPAQSGDEPLLMARRSGLPVVVDPNRPAAAQYLVDHKHCDLLISDDGLQHYRMARDIEIVVVDAVRGLGNGHCLPVGPLRESKARLKGVDSVVMNGDQSTENSGHVMQLAPSQLISLNQQPSLEYKDWPQHRRRVHAVAGIGHPARFFTTLRSLGFEPLEHSFDDHHRFQAGDFAFNEPLPIVMTEKDAVKCRGLALQDAWYLPVDGILPPLFYQQLSATLASL